MPEDEYDLAGFSVGVCDRKNLITGENIKPGDTLVAIKSSGVHSNGFSLVRKVFDMTKNPLIHIMMNLEQLSVMLYLNQQLFMSRHLKQLRMPE